LDGDALPVGRLLTKSSWTTASEEDGNPVRNDAPPVCPVSRETRDGTGLCNSTIVGLDFRTIPGGDAR
jgi:hypothetical protein